MAAEADGSCRGYQHWRKLSMTERLTVVAEFVSSRESRRWSRYYTTEVKVVDGGGTVFEEVHSCLRRLFEETHNA